MPRTYAKQETIQKLLERKDAKGRSEPVPSHDRQVIEGKHFCVSLGDSRRPEKYIICAHCSSHVGNTVERREISHLLECREL